MEGRRSLKRKNPEDVEETKPKRKRGRPRKVKTSDSTEKAAPPLPAEAASPALQPSSQVTARQATTRGSSKLKSQIAGADKASDVQPTGPETDPKAQQRQSTASGADTARTAVQPKQELPKGGKLVTGLAQDSNQLGAEDCSENSGAVQRKGRKKRPGLTIEATTEAAIVAVAEADVKGHRRKSARLSGAKLGTHEQESKTMDAQTGLPRHSSAQAPAQLPLDGPSQGIRLRYNEASEAQLMELRGIEQSKQQALPSNSSLSHHRLSPQLGITPKPQKVERPRRRMSSQVKARKLAAREDSDANLPGQIHNSTAQKAFKDAAIERRMQDLSAVPEDTLLSETKPKPERVTEGDQMGGLKCVTVLTEKKGKPSTAGLTKSGQLDIQDDKPVTCFPWQKEPLEKRVLLQAQTEVKRVTLHSHSDCAVAARDSTICEGSSVTDSKKGQSLPAKAQAKADSERQTCLEVDKVSEELTTDIQAPVPSSQADQKDGRRLAKPKSAPAGPQQIDAMPGSLSKPVAGKETKIMVDKTPKAHPESATRRARRSLQLPTAQKGSLSPEHFPKPPKSAQGVKTKGTGKRRSNRLSENVDPRSPTPKIKRSSLQKQLVSSERPKQRSPLTELPNQILTDQSQEILKLRLQPNGIEAQPLNFLETENRIKPCTQGCPAERSNLSKAESGSNRSQPLGKGVEAAQQDPNWFDPLIPEKVQLVEAALHVSNPPKGTIPLGRATQAQELANLLRLHVENRQGGAIYISGLPGTGKSLTVHEVVRRFAEAEQSQCCMASINCMSLNQPASVFSRAYSGLQTAITGASEVPSLIGSRSEVTDMFKDFVTQPSWTPSRKGKAAQSSMLVLILDEMDQLVSLDKSVLYDLFTLPQIPQSRLVLVGISNSIDMAERKLPRLREMGCHPHSIPFNSYSATQIADILKERLRHLPGPVFQNIALSFCSRKIAGESGDMRKALEACSAALSQHRMESVANSQAQAINGDDEELSTSNPSAPSKLIGIGHMAKAISKVQGGTGEESAVVRAMRSLPQQQQIALCAATKLLGQDQASRDNSAATPPSTAKVSRSRGASFMSPVCENTVQTPSGKAHSRFGTPSKTSGLGQTPARAFNPKTPSSKAPGSGSKLWGRTPAKTPRSLSKSFSGTLRPEECLMGTLHDAYCQLCRQLSMAALSSMEFASTCSMLADMGVIVLGHAREERLRKISLKTHKDDIVLALGEVRLLKNVLCC